MSQGVSDFDFSNLGPSARVELIGLIWDSLGGPDEPLAAPQWHQDELARRMPSADAAPDAAIPWDEVKARLQAKL
jgi:putative addiction module component (TIGR02574 family)